MRKLLPLALLLLAIPAFAQNPASGNITAADASGVCTTANACVVSQPLTTAGPNAAATAVVQLTGTFSGTLNFMVVQDGNLANMTAVKCFPPNSSTSVATATAPGKWRCDVSGMSNIVVQGTPWSSGTAAVNITISGAISSSVITGGGNGGSGTVTSVSGTANQVDVATGTTTPVISLDAAITLPGNLTAPTGSTIAATGSGIINATQLGGATFAAPGPIGSGTASTGTFSTLSATGVITSTLATGTAPLTVASTTNVANLNASSLGGATFAAPGAIGGTTPGSGAFTSLSSSGALTNTLAGAASAPGVTFSGAPFTGGSGTTTFPQTYLNAGSAPTTFATTGTMLGINSGASIGNLIDAHVNGGGSVFAVSSSGTTTLAGSIQALSFKNATGGTNHLWYSGTAPTIAAGGCGGSAASIASNNGAGAFTINVGTAPTSGGCAITLPAATTGWNCYVTDITTNSTSVFLQKQTVTSTTGATLVNFSDVAAATAPTANDIWAVSCFAY